MMRIPTDSIFTQQVQVLSSQYVSIANLQSQIANEKKLLASSDDPVLASQIKLATDYINNLNAYSQSATAAENRTELFSTSIQQSIDLVINIQNIITSAQDDTKNDSDRQTLVTTLTGYLNSLLNTMNTQDGSGDYIYAGYNVNTPPFALINGSYQYQGGYDSTSINIGPNSGCLYSESGYKVFGNIATGNGTFSVTAASTNTGTGLTNLGSVTSSAYVPDTYTISFVTNGSNELSYYVTGASSGQVLPPLPTAVPAGALPYTAGSDITFNGVNLEISGTPNVGDTFTVAPSSNQNVLNDLQALINAVGSPIDGDPVAHAQYYQQLTQLQGTFTNVLDNLRDYESSVGTRLLMVYDKVDENQSLIYDQTEILQELADLDPIQAISQLDEQKLALQVTQGTYNVIQQLLLQLLQIG